MQRPARDFARNGRHWMPQTDVSLFDYVGIAFAGRVETLEDDIGHVMMTAFGGREHERLDHLRHETRSVSRIHEHFTPSDMRAVLEIYERDFDLLGYSEVLGEAAPVAPVRIGASGRFGKNPKFLAKLDAASAAAS